MKTLLYALLAVVLLAVAAVLVGPSLIDWNAYRDAVARRVEAATGREVTVAGDLSLTMLPRPALSAENVTLANVSGGSAQAMAQVAELRLKVQAAPLLQGDLQVARIDLVTPRVLLERLPDGRANWRLSAEGSGRPAHGGPDGGPDAGPGGGPGGGLLAGLLDQISLDSMRVVDGTLRYRDPARGLDERLTDIDGELTARSLSGPFNASGRLTARGVRADFQAALGRLDRRGATAYSLELGLPDRPARASLSGALAAAGADGPALRGDLQLRGDDLAAVLARLSGGGDGPGPPQLAQSFQLDSQLRLDGKTLKAQALSLRLGPTGADGSLQVAFAETVEATADLTVQRLDLDRLLAMAPRAGGGEANGAGRDRGNGGSGAGAGFALPEGIDGQLNLNVGAIVYRDRVIRQGRVNAVLEDGTVTLNQAMALLPGSSDAALFGTLTGGPDGPLFEGRLEAASDNLRGVFDWLGLPTGGVAEDRLRRMSLLADVRGTAEQISLTGIDLDVDTAHVTGGVAIALRRRPALGVGLTVDKLNLDAYLPTPGAAMDGPGPRAALGGFDANFDLRAGQVTYAGETARDLAFDATLQRGDLTVRTARIGALAGGTIALDGTLTGLDADAAPEADLGIELEVSDLRRLAALAGGARSVPAELGPITLTGALQGGPERARIDGTVTGLGGTATFQGTLQPLAGPPALDLILGVQHDSLQALAKRLPALPAFAQDPGPLDLTSRIQGTPRRLHTDTLTGRIGPVKLSGPMTLTRNGPRPKLTAQLETDALPVQAFALARPLARDTGGATGGTEGGGADGAPWSAQPLGLDGLQALDAELSLKADALRFAPDTALADARLAATLAGGVLDLEQLTGTLFGGSVEVSGMLDGRETPAASLRLTGRDLAAGPLLQRTAGLSGLDGPVSLDSQLTAKGTSERALIESLNGDGSLTGQVTVEPRLVLGAQAGTLSDGDGAAAQRLSQMLGDALGQQVEIKGLRRALDFVAKGFAERPAKLTGGFRIKNGVLETRDLTLDSLDGRAEIDATVDLPGWRLDAATRLYRARDPSDRPFVVTRQRGPLGSPDVAVTGGAFQDTQTPETEAPDQDTPTPDASAATPEETGGGTADAPAAEPAETAADAADAETTQDADDTGAAGPRDTDGDGDADGDETAPDGGAGPADGQDRGGNGRAEEIIRGVLDTLKDDSP